MIKVIDLFAGPGGLGEGFTAFKTENGKLPFSIIASVEKEASAHRTLTLRSFYRKFKKNCVPNEYYQYIQGEITRETLFSLYPKESEAALEETLQEPKSLGTDNLEIHSTIKQRLGKEEEFRVVIGGPPCQAYSLAGRAKNMNDQKYNAKEDIRNFLYKEYLNILCIVNPQVFVMENVKGILSSSIDGEKLFPRIINDLQNPSKAINNLDGANYKIYSLVKPALDPLNPYYKDTSDFVIKSEAYGIPQSRHRVILLGVREDIKKIPSTLIPTEPVNIEQVIGDLPRLRSGLSKNDDTTENWNEIISEFIKSMPKQLSQLKFKDVAQRVTGFKSEQLLNLTRGALVYKDGKLKKSKLPKTLHDWVLDPKLKSILNHETRGHIVEDLRRYLFCTAFAQEYSERENPNPKSHEFPDFLAPDHKNWKSGKFTDRFRVQAKGKYATTITCHISKDGHYFIHYDPLQCRSITVREAARIQTFPDNYFFEGNRTQQYVQVGNAVPSYLANQISKIVYELFI